MIILLALCIAAAAYQLLAIAACLYHLTRRDESTRTTPAVSILKPVHGSDAGFYKAIRSHATLRASAEHEILFGVSAAGDPAVADVERLCAELPNAPIRLIVCPTVTANPKVGILIDLAREAKYSTLVVNDADIYVGANYLNQVTGQLQDRRVSLVTCLYRASASSFPAKFEALGIATDFVPSALVAPITGVKDFAFGSTLAFRAEDLRLIGGFESIADYIADDYQLGKRLSTLGRVHMAELVVDTHLSARTWADAWHHQVRWARTVRVSHEGGYAGLPLTNATFWAIVAMLCGWQWLAAGLLFLRIAMGLIAGVGVLNDPITSRYWWLMPLRDLFGLAVWVTGMWGKTVVWAGKKLRLSSGGKLELN